MNAFYNVGMQTLLKIIKTFFRIMLITIKWFFSLFSGYVHPFERTVDGFIKKLHDGKNFFTVQNQLLELMQQDLVVISLWLEKKFKGYQYLSKRVRRKMYKNREILVKDFKKFGEKNPIDIAVVKQILQPFHVTEHTDEAFNKFAYIIQIMRYLSPDNKYFYLESSSFGKLLRNPLEEKLEGDCNQIVTLYTYLYGLKFPLKDLEIKLPKDHICLHLFGVDIEATNATFQDYEEYEDILPITELISSNLLDISDFRENQITISERTLLKSAQLAFLISSKRELVTKNLRITYHNLAWEAAHNNNYQSAVFFIEKAEHPEDLKKIYNNAVIYFAEKKNFSKARYYQEKSHDTELARWVNHAEGAYYYENKKWKKALALFQKTQEKQWQEACYQGEYYELYKKVENNDTIQKAKRHKSTYKKMLQLAKKLGDYDRTEWVQSILSQL